MRIKSRFLCTIMDEAEAKKLYEVAGIKFKPCIENSAMYVLEVFNDTDEYLKVLEHFKTHPPKIVTKTEDEVFTQEELLSAPLLQMVPNAHRGGYPQPISGERQIDYLRCSYDMTSGCPGCSKGLLQNRPLRLSGGIKIGKTNDISGIFWLREYIVTRKLRELIENARLTGVEFWPIIKHGNGEFFEDLFQLKITGELPPMSPKTIIKHQALRKFRYTYNCDCGALTVEERVHYRADDIADVPDFALTYEWLGGNYEFWRWPFMSHKAYQLFHDNKIKGIRWYPPTIDD